MHGENKLPTGSFVCPAPNCTMELVAYYRNGKRFLRKRPGTQGCNHHLPTSNTFGPMSDEHLWFQRRIAFLIEEYIGLPAHLEHNYADIWVESDPPLAIEIQRWPSDVDARAKRRQQLGAKTIWLFPESADSPQIDQALFNHSVARVRVFKQGSTNSFPETKPWENKTDRGWRVSIGATVLGMKQQREGSKKTRISLESIGNYDAITFFREIIEKKRRWYDKQELDSMVYSGWAYHEEYEYVRASEFIWRSGQHIDGELIS